MIDYLLHDYTYQLEVLALIIAVITYKYYKNTKCKHFLHFLLITVIIESISLLPVINSYYPNFREIYFIKFLSDDLINRNDWIYNIYYLLYYPFYIMFYRGLINSLFFKKGVFILLIIYIILSFFDLIFNIDDFTLDLLTISLIIGTLSLLISICFYLYEIINSSEILKFHLTLVFWLTLGVLFFNLVTPPIYIFYSVENDTKLFNKYYREIHEISNYILYGSFIIGFIINAYQEKKKLNTVNTY